MADFIGTSGNDVLSGLSTEANRIYGLDGNDILVGGALIDLLDGGNGDDVLYGRAGNDTLLGGAGNDQLFGEEGNDTLSGGVGNDSLRGGLGNDVLEGGAGNDYLLGGGNANTTAQSAGGDTYKFAMGSGVDHINDYDTTVGNTDVALFSGVASTAVSALERKGDDLVLTYSASDQLIVDNYFYTDFFDASLQGHKIEQFKFSNGVTWDAATIKARVITVGTALGDTIVGYNDGTNRIYGLDGNDTLYGGALADRIDGGKGDDTLYGQAGDDTLLGGVGADILRGGLGNDVLEGGAGNDYLLGGGNANTTAQSAGSDTYKFALGSGVDHINDYDTTVGNTDVALFSGVASTAVSSLERKGNDLVLTYSAGDQLIVDNYF